MLDSCPFPFLVVLSHNGGCFLVSSLCSLCMFCLDFMLGRFLSTLIKLQAILREMLKVPTRISLAGFL